MKREKTKEKDRRREEKMQETEFAERTGTSRFSPHLSPKGGGAPFWSDMDVQIARTKVLRDFVLKL